MHHNSAPLCVFESAAEWLFKSILVGGGSHILVDKMPKPCVTDLAWLIPLGPVMQEMRTFKIFGVVKGNLHLQVRGRC